MLFCYSENINYEDDDSNNDNNDNNDDDNIIEGDDYGDGKERTVLVFCDEPWNGHKNDKTAMMTL